MQTSPGLDLELQPLREALKEAWKGLEDSIAEPPKYMATLRPCVYHDIYIYIFIYLS